MTGPRRAHRTRIGASEARWLELGAQIVGLLDRTFPDREIVHDHDCPVSPAHCVAASALVHVGYPWLVELPEFVHVETAVGRWLDGAVTR